MPIETDLSIDPYYDDFDETKNFHKILFRPAVPVQARELTQLQTILQNQIERFGDNIFVEGTVIQGCNFNFDSQLDYVKLPDLRVDGQPTNPAQYVGKIARDATTNLHALVIDSVDGYESQNPDLKTIYLKYLNSGNNNSKAFSNGMQLTFYANAALIAVANVISGYDVAVANTQINSINTNPVGTGYSFSVSEGIIFQKGHFIRVANNISAVVSKYSASPNNVSVGFTTEEEIVTEYADTSLLDNASGYSNRNAPGAHRLKLTPSLVVANTNDANATSNNFLSLVDWKNGNPVKINQNSQYNKIGNEMARRTAESAGDYVVKKFRLGSEVNYANTSYFNMTVGAGLGYVGGFRTEQLNTSRVGIRKGTDTKTLTTQSLSVSYGNYIKVKEAAGYFNIGANVNLYSANTSAITANAYTTIAPTGTQIGTAMALSYVYDSGTVDTPEAQYLLYLTNVKMNAGQTFAAVKGVAGAGNTGVADVILEFNPTSSSNVAVLKDTNLSKTVFPTGKSAVKTLVPSSTATAFIYRTISNTTFNANGYATPIVLTGNTQFPYGTGNLSSTNEQSLIVIPATTVNAITNTGTVTTVNGSANVDGSTTSFTTQYKPDDYITVGNSTNYSTKKIASIANNTFLLVTNAYGNTYTSNTHNKTYPKNIPINFADRASFINQSNNTSLSFTTVMANGVTQETLSAAVTVSVYHDVKAITTAKIQKSSIQQNHVAIRASASNNAGNTVGPWSLGFPDVYRLRKVYKVNSAANAWSNSSTYDVTSEFSLLPNQTDTTYNLSQLALRPGSGLTITSDDKILAVVDLFTIPANSTGFFSVDSYPIDDANTASTTAIQTQYIPKYTSSTGQVINLRDAVDFRLYAANTIDLANNLTYASNATNLNPGGNNVYTANTYITPDEVFTYDSEYYLGRFDKLILNASGKFAPLEGIPAETPNIPSDQLGAMTLGTIYVPPYPTLIPIQLDSVTADYSTVTYSENQNRKYSMKDIAALNRRISTIEYYTSLSLLETKTKDLVIKNDTTGLDRFKNGIFVDNFETTLASNLTDSEYNIGKDTRENTLIPKFQEFKFQLQVDTNSTNAQLVTRTGGNTTFLGTGDTVTLAYTESTFLEQTGATRTRNCTEGYYNWGGIMGVSPSYDSFIDVRNAPITQTPSGGGSTYIPPVTVPIIITTTESTANGQVIVDAPTPYVPLPVPAITAPNTNPVTAPDPIFPSISIVPLSIGNIAEVTEETGWPLEWDLGKGQGSANLPEGFNGEGGR